MILTKCAVCARAWFDFGQEMRPLQHPLLRRRVPEKALEEGGHDKLCKPIKKAGAEQYNANKKYAEAVAVAVEKCGGHQGPDVLHCTQAPTGKQRRASCAGVRAADGGFAHVSCLAEQAKILVEANENDADDNRWHRWHTWACASNLHGVVRAGGRAGRRTGAAGDGRRWR